MEKVVFGDKETFLTNLAKSVGHKRPKASEATGADNEESGDETQGAEKKRKAAWEDSDDEDIEVGDVKKETRHTGPLTHLRKDKSYKAYLTSRFERTTKQPKWASLDKKAEQAGSDSEDEELLRTVGFIDYKAKARDLQPKNLNFKRVRDLNRATYSEGIVTSIQFHPTSTAALVSGANGIATIYTVDGQKNEKLHNMNFKKFPLFCTRLTPDGTKAFFGSKNRFYYAYDLLEAKETKRKLPDSIKTMHMFELSPCGKYIASAGHFGALHLIDANTNELLHTFKQEGTVCGMCFTADSERLFVSGASCNINVMSVRQQRIEHSFIDEGCVNSRVVQLAPNQRLLATGSKEGVVNVYNYESIFKSKTPQPEKCFMNLRTGIANLEFNHTSELLAMSSRQVPNAVKLAHFPSATVYSNFPGQQENVGFVNTLSFSPNSGFLALGGKAKVPLFRVKHFKHY
ncbi:wcd [Drosophila busckii]|uniref:Wcd n=2 Tax=Drosophila busckii TaxID=30019 RepID=A0A0M4E9D8_DROBS|nr:wcd [Drosophila busckii]